VKRSVTSLSLIVILVSILSACGPSADDIAATYVAQTAEAATDTPLPPTATPIPPTNTPAPPTDTPIPTNTPVPFAEIKELGVSEGEVLFEDDFETGFGNQWAYMWGSWQVVDEDGVEGNKVYYSEIGETMTPLWTSSEWTNYQVGLRMKVIDLPSSGSGVGIKFRHATGEGCPSYSVWFGRDGIGLSLSDEKCSTARNLGWWNTPVRRDQWVNLRIALVDEAMLVYLDEVLILKATDDSLPNGGIRLLSWEEALVYFDDVRVVELVSK
jgi:hypothetical protein